MEGETILIIGAGVAGLSAARALAETGRSVTLLEAAPRIGGRIFTIHDGEEVIELGAEFVHGRPPELWALIEEAGLATYELDGPTLAFEDGKITAHDEQTEAFSMLDPLEARASSNQPDITFAEYLAQNPGLSDEERRTAIGFVEGFNAADHRVISAAALGLQQAAEEAIDGDRLFRIRAGYSALVEYLARKFEEAGGTLRLSTLVERVEWSRGRVVVSANQGGRPVTFEASQAVITLPLGVLQHRAVEFVPVPDAVHEASRLRMGQVRRFTLLFRERFWVEGSKEFPGAHVPGEFSFLFSFGSMPPVWWTPMPARSHTITGWIGGPRSEALFNLTPEQLGRLACETLATVFALPAEYLHGLLVDALTHDWQTDGLFYGAYSYVPAGALDACSKMTIPVDRTLFFAGEHTDTTGHWGTVHAALRSGMRAARQVLDRER